VSCSGTFSPKGVTIRSFKNYMHKSCSALAPKMLVKLTYASMGELDVNTCKSRDCKVSIMKLLAGKMLKDVG